MIGVKAPTSLRKNDLIKAIIDVDSGVVAPYYSKMGKPKMKKMAFEKFNNNIEISEVDYVDPIEKEIDKALEPLKKLLLRLIKR